MMRLIFFFLDVVTKPKANAKANEMFIPLFESLEIRVSGRDNAMPMPYVHFLMAGFLYVVEPTDFVKTLG